MAVCSLGPGTEPAKADIQSAYRIMPVHLDDRPLLAVQWQSKVFVDGSLPFGLRLAPKIFNALVEALEWCVKHQGAKFMWHYLDNFVTIGHATSRECSFNCDLLHHVCKRLGVPLALDKCEGPATCITFLGIVIDSMAMELRLPQEKQQMFCCVFQCFEQGFAGTDFDRLGLSFLNYLYRTWKTFYETIYM